MAFSGREAIQTMQRAHGDTTSSTVALLSVEAFCKVYPYHNIDGVYDGNL